MKKLLILCLISCCFAFSDKEHGIYISVVEVKHSTSPLMTTIRIKVFKDDLQNALQNAFPAQKEQFVLTSNFCEAQKIPIEQYFSENFKLKINDKTCSLKLKKGEDFSDAYWLHFQTKSPEIWKTLHIKAPFFMELFPNQSNILTIRYGKKKRFERLTIKKSVKTFRF